LVSHYTSEELANRYIQAGKITAYESHVYVFDGRSGLSRARDAGATLTEVRIVFYARPTELEIDPHVFDREKENADRFPLPPLPVIHDARRFRIPGSVDISWRSPCIERPISHNIFFFEISFGQWELCPGM